MTRHASSRLRRPFLMVCAVLMAAPIVVGLPAAVAAADADAPYRYYWLETSLYSFVPDVGIDSYDAHGGGGVSGNGTVGLGVADDHRRFRVSVTGRLQSHQFGASIEVTPHASDSHTEPMEREVDLAGLQPKSIDLARDDDGRIYRLLLVPTVRQAAAPRAFATDELELARFSFPQSPVVLNEQQYLGQLSMSGGSVAWVEIPGTAMVEFSLLRLTDSEPIGTLKDGTIEITRDDGTLLRIANVENGTYREVLPGGPWIVWVRWQPPTYSLEQYRERVERNREQLAELRRKVAAGDAYVPPAALKRLEAMGDSDHIGLVSSGLRSARPDEVVAGDE